LGRTLLKSSSYDFQVLHAVTIALGKEGVAECYGPGTRQRSSLCRVSASTVSIETGVGPTRAAFVECQAGRHSAKNLPLSSASLRYSAQRLVWGPLELPLLSVMLASTRQSLFFTEYQSAHSIKVSSLSLLTSSRRLLFVECPT
jgi:hypothetical protein